MLCVISISLTVMAAPADLDPTFGSGGKVISSPDGSNLTSGNGMALQPDGKIVMVGGRRGSPGLSFIVARYNANGSLDTTFGNNGWVSTTFVNSNEGATSVAIQPDGKIVVGGNIHSLADIGIARFNSNGSLDTSFDGDGKVTVGFSDFAGSYPDFLSSLKIGNDGKIVFAGGAQGLGLNYKTILGRLNADGSLDTWWDTTPTKSSLFV